MCSCVSPSGAFQMSAAQMEDEVLEARRRPAACLIKAYTWKQYEPRLRSLCATPPTCQPYCRRPPPPELRGAAASAFVWAKCTQMLTAQCKHDSTWGSRVMSGRVMCKTTSFCDSDWLETDGVFLKDLFAPGNRCSHSAAPLDRRFVVCVAQKKKKTSS